MTITNVLSTLSIENNDVTTFTDGDINNGEISLVLFQESNVTKSDISGKPSVDPSYTGKTTSIPSFDDNGQPITTQSTNWTSLMDEAENTEAAKALHDAKLSVVWDFAKGKHADLTFKFGLLIQNAKTDESGADAVVMSLTYTPTN